MVGICLAFISGSGVPLRVLALLYTNLVALSLVLDWSSFVWLAMYTRGLKGYYCFVVLDAVDPCFFCSWFMSVLLWLWWSSVSVCTPENVYLNLFLMCVDLNHVCVTVKMSGSVERKKIGQTNVVKVKEVT